MDDNTVFWIIFVLGMIAVAMVWVEGIRRKNNNRVKGHILVEMVPEMGPVVEELMPYNGIEVRIHYEKGQIKTPKKSPRNKLGRKLSEIELLREVVQFGEYFADASCTAPTLYPHTRGPGRHVSAYVEKVIFREGNPEPLTKPFDKREELLGTPKVIADYRNERFSEVSKAYDLELDQERQKVHDLIVKQMSRNFVYAALVIAIIAAGVAGYMGYTATERINDLTEVTKAGFGLP